jgi:flagellar basal-body rod protein FlgC
MSIGRIFDIAGSALNAQMVRMNLTASNLANATTAASSPEEAFKAKKPVFRTMLDEEASKGGSKYGGGVRIEKIFDDTAAAPRIHEPSHPQADKDGYVYKSNVNEVTETVEMMAAARSYQNNIEVSNTARELMLKTIDMIKG